MRRDFPAGQGQLVTALLKQAAEKFGPPAQWTPEQRDEIALWIRSEVGKTLPTQFDPRAAQTGERE